MVLSNKKLKHKLRAAKSELITASGAENTFRDKKYEKSQDFDSKASDSLKTILDLEAQRSRLSKRAKPKRVKLRPAALTENADIIENGKISGDVEPQLQDGLNSDTMQVEKKKEKKRKRDESERSEKMKEKRNLKKKKKRPRYWWLEKKKNKDTNKTEEVENGAVKEEGVNQNENGSTGEQLVAKADDIIDNHSKNVEMSQKVYVGGIPYYSTEDDIRSFFEGCGTITHIDCMTFPDTGKFRGIAIISFKTEAATKRALALDGSDMGGLFLKVQPFKSAKENKLRNFTPSVPEGYNRIYVGNLSWDITEDDLRNIFVDCTIKSIRFGEDKETGIFKGYAHVDLADSLSLKVALKLDQTVVCGRPVRITCAVLKGTASESKPMPKDNQVDSHKAEEEVTATVLKATPKDTQVDYGYNDQVGFGYNDQVGYGYNDQVDYGYNVSAAVENQVPSSGANAALNAKIRRRTCYECGEKGHLSSACPKKQAADAANPGTASESKPMPKDNQVRSHKAEEEVTATVLKATPKDTQVDYGYNDQVGFGYNNQVGYGYNDQVGYGYNDQVPSSGANAALNAKIRRRTCYECGEKGHLSSACPKKQAADAANPGTASESKPMPKDNQVRSHKAEEEVTATVLKATPEAIQVGYGYNDQVGYGYNDQVGYGYNVSAAVENQVPSSGTNAALNSKIRRRTCYECGEKGHLSSACPKKQAADAANPGTS